MKKKNLPKIFAKKTKKNDFGNWYNDNYRMNLWQRNMLFFLFLITLIGLISTSFVILFMNKTQTLEPFVVEIEDKTGIVSIVDQATVKNYSANETMNNYFIVKYLRLREIFDNNNYKYNYYTMIRLFSSPQVFNDFMRYIGLSNPESPLNIYANNPIINGNVKIKSIQYIEDTLVQIRYIVQITTQRSERFNQNNEKSYIAVIRFAYNDIDINESERYVNPLGFHIISFKKTEEFIQ